jgi:hypothetical protein
MPRSRPQVAGNAVAWVPSAPGGPFKRVDTRSFMVATTDLMGSYYVTLPRGERLPLPVLMYMISYTYEQ